MTSHQIHISVPTKWEDLTQKQLEYVGRMMLLDLPDMELISRCFLRFADMKILSKDPVDIDGELHYKFSMQGQGEFVISVDVFTDMLTRLGWLTAEVTLFHHPERFGPFIGCHWKLYGVTLEEYLIADQMYISYIRTREIKYIDNLMAVLYRKRDEDFAEGANIERNAKRLSRATPAQKQVIVLWYTAIKLWLKTKYPYLFSDQGSESDESPVEFVMALQSALNEGDVTHNSQIRKTDVHEVFYELNRKIEQSQKI